jgi:hypothetical protein
LRDDLNGSRRTKATIWKAEQGNQRGYDDHKKINWRKRHIAFDTEVRLPAVELMSAEVPDSTDAQFILDAIIKG